VLRVLQEGEVERLGIGAHDQSRRPRDCRDQQEPREEIEKGHFREDLYFRLAVIPVYVRRCASVLTTSRTFVRHFMEYFSRRQQRAGEAHHAAALETLQRHRWKGNIRELRNTVERLIIMTNSGRHRRRRPAGGRAIAVERCGIRRRVGGGSPAGLAR